MANKHPFETSLDQINEKLDFLVSTQRANLIPNFKYQLLTSKDVTILFKITAATLKNWRKTNFLNAVNLKGSYYYRKQDILDLIDSNDEKKVKKK